MHLGQARCGDAGVLRRYWSSSLRMSPLEMLWARQLAGPKENSWHRLGLSARTRHQRRASGSRAWVLALGAWCQK